MVDLTANDILIFSFFFFLFWLRIACLLVRLSLYSSSVMVSHVKLCSLRLDPPANTGNLSRATYTLVVYSTAARAASCDRHCIRHFVTLH